MLQEIIQPQGIYQDKRGNKYRVTALARHIQTDEMLVVYEEMFGDFEMLACPSDAFRVSMESAKATDEVPEASAPLEEAKKPTTGTEMMMAFLETRSFDEKVSLLKEMYVQNELTDSIIDNLAAALDVVIESGDLQMRYEQLRRCVETRLKYETTRLR